HRDIFVVVQSAGLPTGADWAEYIADAADSEFRGALVVSNGAKLTPTQRADVERLLKKNNAKNAVVTDSIVTRGVATALAWFGVPVRAFQPRELLSALDYLDVPSEQRSDVLALVERLQRTLSNPSERARPHA